jgi:RNA polymerase sigma factor (sigma-70 family)
MTTETQGTANFELVEKRVTENFPLAIFYAKQALDLDFDEAVSVAMKGLLKAAETYDENRSISFGTYVSVKIKWELLKLLTFLRWPKRGFYVPKVSLDEPVGDDATTTLADHLEDANSDALFYLPKETDEIALVMQLIETLSPRSQAILKLHYGIDCEPITLEEIGRQYGITRERVRKLEEKALEALRVKIREHAVHQFLNGKEPVNGTLQFTGKT